jgi:hypothetical protein
MVFGGMVWMSWVDCLGRVEVEVEEWSGGG